LVRLKTNGRETALTTEIVSVLSSFACCFTKPTWKNIQTLFIGAVLCRGARQVTKILRVMGLSQEKNFSRYHNVLSRSKWSGLALAKILLGLLLPFIPSGFPILIAVDETLERRQGKKIKAKGAYRDAVRSSQAKVVISFGLKWECMTLIVPLPWCKRYWALPFLTVLAPSKKSNEAKGVHHKTSIDWTMQMISAVSRWIKRKPWILLGDGAYACMDLSHHCLKRGANLISRFRLDAQLFEEVVPQPKKLGRKPIKGTRIYLKHLLDDMTKPWQCAKVKWYGGEQKCLEFLTMTCLWYQAGKKPLPVRIVLIKTPDGKNVAEVLFSTSVNHTATQIVEWFVLRWNIEVTFEEVRAHLGVETQRQWSDQAIARTTPILMGLYSIVTIIGLKLVDSKKLIQSEITTWYDKQSERTFSDILIAVRNVIWREKHFSKSENNGDFHKLSDEDINQLIYQLSLTG
jgi:hypothetical protein|tara:strand:+ start:81 stop:1457 length:1377 start_codon:yes stop_codon:yes gene_type:complete